MKRVLLAGLLLSLATVMTIAGAARASETADSSLSQELPLVLEMAAEDLDFLPGPPAGHDAVEPPSLQNLREGVFAMIGEEGMTGELAYRYLLAVLEAGADAPAVFRPRALALLDSLALSPEERQDIVERLGPGGAALGLGSEPFPAPAARPRPAALGEGAIAGVGTGAGGSDNPGEVFSEVQAFIEGLPKFFPGKHKLAGAIDLVRELIVPPDESCYTSDPWCVFYSNQGIIEHISRRISEDGRYLLDSLRFYARLQRFDQEHPHAGDFSVFDRAPGGDVWSLALASVAGDPRRALRVLEVYGHDECCNVITYTGKRDGAEEGGITGFIDLLNWVSPTAFHGDSPASLLQAPGSLAGTNVGSFDGKFRKLLARYDALGVARPDLPMGYYHVFGGMLTADELIRAGFGKADALKLAVFLSEGLGYYYKKFTFPNWLGVDGEALWEQIGHDERKKPQRPAGWDVTRFAKAELDLDTQLLFLDLTRREHQAGAGFAFRVLQ